jgi:TolA-binding protein
MAPVVEPGLRMAAGSVHEGRMKRATAVLALSIVVGGCATQADLLRQERKLTEMMQQQSRSMDDMRREIERLREDVGPGRGTRAPARVPGKPLARKPALESPPAGAPLPPSAAIGETPSPEGTSSEDPAQTERTIAALSGSGTAPAPAAAAGTGDGLVAAAPAAPAPAEAEPSSAPMDEDWRREVAQEKAVASASPSPERARYIGALDQVAKGDCARMKAVADGGSPLSDNAIYWQGKCLAARGDQRKAEARLDEVVARYPKSDKAPAALWTRGQLQLRAGNASAARTTLARLIRDYPASAEAAKARKKLAELPN